jgi:hypothetical protein
MLCLCVFFAQGEGRDADGGMNNDTGDAANGPGREGGEGVGGAAVHRKPRTRGKRRRREGPQEEAPAGETEEAGEGAAPDDG